MEENMDTRQLCLSSLAVILPSLNPDKKFLGVVDGLIEKGFEHIVVVDDGSDDEHQQYFTQAQTAHPEIVVLHHGEIAELGTHKELMAHGGIYKKLYELSED